MPRIRGFTEEQKLESSLKPRSERIRKGLFAYKGLHGLNNIELGKQLGLSNVTVGRFLRGERVELTIEQWLRVVSLAGLAADGEG